MRGSYGFKQGQKSREIVYKFFKKNMFATQQDCADKLGLSRATVNRAAKAIRNGWKPGR